MVLFLAMFSPDELRRFLRYGPAGAEMEIEIPGRDVSAARLAEDAVRVLESRGLIGPELWQRLAGERPRRAAEIDDLARAWNAAASASASTPTAGAPASNEPQYLVATALTLEFQAFARRLATERTTRETAAGTILELGILIGAKNPRRVALVETGHGNEDASLVVSDALGHLPSVKGVVFVGIAGGVKDVALGDVVASDRVYAYEYGKDLGSSFMPRPHLGNSAYKFVQRARAVSRKTEWLARAGIDANLPGAPRIHIGPIAAGSKVVAGQRSAAAQVVQQHYGDALAIEMEGYGALRAAWLRNTEAIVIRGISDLLDKKSASDKAGWQDRAAAHAAAFAAELLGSL